MGTESETNPFAIVAYRRLFAAHAISLAGTGVTTIALALLAWKLGGAKAGQILGTALALKMAVYVFLSPVMAAKAQRLPRRRWLVTLDLLRGGLVLLLPLVTEVWQIYVIVVLVHLCSAGFTPVYQATIPDLVTNHDAYNKALSYTRVAYNLEHILSPLAAAALLHVMTFDTLFLLDAGTFVVSAGLVATVALPRPQEKDRADSVFRDALWGIQAYVRTPRLRAVFAMYLTVACASSMVIVNTVVYVGEYLAGSESETALAYGAAGCGAIVAALLLPAWLRRSTPRMVFLCGAVLLVLALVATASTPGWRGFLVLWCLIGGGLSICQTPVGAVIRDSCNPGDSPAYFAASFSLSHLCWLGGYLIAGFTGAYLGFAASALFLAGLAVVGLVLLWRIYPNPDPLELEHTHEALTHDHAHAHDEHHRHAGHEGAHSHAHTHEPVTHSHRYVIDLHHPRWPNE